MRRCKGSALLLRAAVIIGLSVGACVPPQEIVGQEQRRMSACQYVTSVSEQCYEEAGRVSACEPAALISSGRIQLHAGAASFPSLVKLCVYVCEGQKNGLAWTQIERAVLKGCE